MRHASALDFALLESQISAILAAIEVEIEHSLDGIRRGKSSGLRPYERWYALVIRIARMLGLVLAGLLPHHEEGERVDELVVVVVGLEVVLGDAGNATEGNDRRGCTYKEFLACNPKEYDGKGGVIMYTCWIEKMESAHNMSGCRDSQRVKYTAGLFGGKDLTWWNSEIRTRGREAARRNEGEPSNDRNGREDNKRTKTGNAFATTANPVKGGYTGMAPKCTACGYHHLPETPCRSCFNCNRLGARGNQQNQVVAVNGGQGHGNQGNQARGRAFTLGTKEARQDLNIVTDIEPNDLSFGYKIEITSRQLVEIDKVIRGMDWLSDHKAEIIFHEKVVRIPLLDGKVPFLRHVINGDGIHVDPRLAGYYRRFIKDFSKIAKTLTVLTQKFKTFDWGEEQENAFQTLKDKLCNAFVLALPNGPEDFVVYCDASGLGLGCVLMQRELFSDCDCKIHYHPGKANVVADALSRKERVKPKRVRAMNMTLQSSIKDRILVAQKEASDESAGLQKGLDEMVELRNDRALYNLDRIWVPLKGDVRTLIMDVAHKSKYSVHPGADKMYYDIRDRYWWSGIKKDIDVYDYKMDRMAKLYLHEIVARHGVPITIISDRDSRFTSSMRCASFEALYGSKCRSPIMWAEVGEKSYADKRRKPLEFSVGDYVLLKVSHWKGVVHFGKKGKLAPRFVGPFEIIEKVGLVAYMLDLPEELDGVHDTYHVSNLKKCLADPTLQVPLDEIRVDDKLNFMEEPMEIIEREFKNLKRSRLAIVKV
uniref:Reverse transcriptase domain-containing protein n=1 Tax=Tanacetum cinerariifolium TaxID=118510 RepID=A0A699GQL4_TANCI|nr:hypothetical protein [Tanacetum cinerariifolium]